MLHVYRHHSRHVCWWAVPFIGIGWLLVACAWLLVWTLVWFYEAYVVGSVRAFNTTRAVFHWPR